MKTMYYLDVLLPGEDKIRGLALKSETPFGAINIGDIIKTESLDDVKVTKIEHLFVECKNSPTEHHLYIHTELS